MLIADTSRLRLRWFTADDAAFILGLLNDPDWIRHIGNRHVHTEDDARCWLQQRLMANYWKQGIGFWAVERLEDGALMGMCGLIHRDGLPDPDVGYAFMPAFRGQGYAREAVRAALAHGRRLGIRRILAIVSPDNQASRQLLLDVGLSERGMTRLPGGDEDLVLFSDEATMPAA
jgi:RimJ/RimL family protein N-acetyltransferase